MCPGAPIRSEVLLSLPAGCTLLLDSRLWWSPASASSQQPQPPVVAVASYAPWWLCTDYGGRNQALVDPGEGTPSFFSQAFLVNSNHLPR